MSEYRSKQSANCQSGMNCFDEPSSGFAYSYKDLRVYRAAFELAMELFHLTRTFPSEEKFSMTDQVRRSSRSVCSNIAEGWRKRRYRNAFIARLSDAESEACETQVWIQFALSCGYMKAEQADKLELAYDHVLGQIVSIIQDADRWLIREESAPSDVIGESPPDTPLLGNTVTMAKQED